MYNKLIFDAGGYTFSFNDYGASEINVPPNQLDNFFDVPENPMKGFGVNIEVEETKEKFNIIPQQGKSRSFFVSFQKLINELGIQDQEFVQFQWIQLSATGKEKLDKMIKSTEEYKKYIKGNHFFQNQILKNFYTSLIFSEEFGAPMMIDTLHDKFLKNIMFGIVKIADIRLEILDRITKLLRFNIPDFSSLEMEDILVLRRDQLFIRFRDKLFEINKNLTKFNIAELDSSVIDPLFMAELIKEMNEIAPSKKNLIVNGFLGILGLIPAIGSTATGAGLLKDSKELYKFEKSWLAFILRQ